MTEFRIGEAADLLGVSEDTVRRMTNSGRLPATRDGRGYRFIKGKDLAAYLQDHGEVVGGRATSSARNRFTGLVTQIKKDTVMAQVEIQSGRHRIVSLMSREAIDELNLDVGDIAVAVVKSTTVIVETPHDGPGTRAR